MRMRLLLAGVAVLALALAACGSGGGPKKTPEQAVSDAYTAMTKTKALVTVEVLFVKTDGTRISAYEEDGNVAPDGAALAIDRRQIGGNLSHEILVRDGLDKLVLYLTPSPTKLPKGKKWLAVDLTAYSKTRYGVPLTTLVSADRDPLQPAKLLTSSVATVKDIGPDNLPINVPCEHYRGTVNLYAAAKADGVKSLGLKAVEADVGHTTQTIDIWIDTKGRIKQMIVAAPEQSSSGTKFTLRETVTFRNYGSGGAIDAPPAAQVQSYSGQ